MATAPKTKVAPKATAAAAAKPAAKPAVKAAPAAKATPAPKATPAAKPAAAKPAPKAKKAQVPTELDAGVIVVFAGYADDVPTEERIIPDGHRASIIEVVPGEQDGDEPSYIIRIPNPDFNPELAEDPDTNPAEIETSAFAAELQIDEDQTPVDAAAAPVETAPTTQVKNGKVKAAPKAKQEVAVDPAAGPADDELPELAQEDATVLALVEEAQAQEGGVIGLAQDMEAEIETKNFQMGGILYHIKRDGAFAELDERYAESGGFQLFVEDHFGFGYRKAMNLIDIYVTLNQLQIEDAAALVAEIGWTKASKIVATMDEENANDLIELARNNTVQALTDAIKSQSVEVGGTPGEKKTRVTLKLKYWEDEAANITETLTAVKEAQGLKTVEEAFAYIVTEFNMSQGEAAPAEAAPVQAKARVQAPAAKVQAKPVARRAAAAAA